LFAERTQGRTDPDDASKAHTVSADGEWVYGNLRRPAGALLVSPAPLVEQWFGTTLAGPPHHDLPRFTQLN
jgi:hypothetical protein